MGQSDILVGTGKGLVRFKKEKNSWIADLVDFWGLPVSCVYKHPFTHELWAGVSHRHWGQKLYRSENHGQKWIAVRAPKYPTGTTLGNGKQASLKKIWTIHHGGSDHPDHLWLGTEPGGLFLSEDRGKSFNLVESLWNHPSRMDQNQWFGAGRDEPFIHSIALHPQNDRHIYIAVSCAGVFESKNGGESWEPKNNGLIATYLPNPQAEIGHDPHRMLLCTSHPRVIWQQNHCGIFRSTDGGSHWENVTDPKGLADYGFALAIDEEDPLQAWVIPATSDEVRVAVDGALCVCHTKDGGKTWMALRDGLPQKNAFDIVFRHAMDKQDDLIVFGTTTGNLYISENAGESWACVHHNLARVETVIIA